MTEHEDEPITVIVEDLDKKMVDKLNEYLATIPKEELKKDFFKIRCENEGIDPNSKNAKRKLWWKDTKHKLIFISHHLGYWTLKILIIAFAWLGGILITIGYSFVHYILFFLCIMCSSILLDVFVDHGKDWFFLRKRN